MRQSRYLLEVADRLKPSISQLLNQQIIKGLWVACLQVVRAPVALAMVKLLKLLPEQAMAGQLPQALQGVAHLLRNRLQRIRYKTYTLNPNLRTLAHLPLKCLQCIRYPSIIICQLLRGSAILLHMSNLAAARSKV